jgi:hypothetical protein
MTPDERTLINGLFDRLAPLGTQPRDAEAEALIRFRVADQPAAPYFLAQNTLVLQQAVTAAQTRIADLEKQLAEARATKPAPSFLSEVTSFLGGGTPSPRSAPPAPTQPPPLPVQSYQPYQPIQPGSAGGGFLRGALTTAAGVAGGALLFQGIEGLLGHNAGAFSGMGGLGGPGEFGAGGLGAQPEVVNNYYEEAPPAASDVTGNDAYNDQSLNDPNADFANLNDDSSFDPGGGFGGDDSSFV